MYKIRPNVIKWFIYNILTSVISIYGIYEYLFASVTSVTKTTSQTGSYLRNLVAMEHLRKLLSRHPYDFLGKVERYRVGRPGSGCIIGPHG